MTRCGFARWTEREDSASLASFRRYLHDFQFVCCSKTVFIPTAFPLKVGVLIFYRFPPFYFSPVYWLLTAEGSVPTCRSELVTANRRGA